MADQEVKTLVLRFRDLVTQPGATIASHQEKIQEHGFVWWGWWNKSGETIPDDVFRELHKQATSTGGLSLFLLDSGRHALYSSIATEIYWSPVRARVPSRDKAATPSYYSHQEYLAWFRLTQISPVPDASILGRFSYVEIDQFFEAGTSRYMPFSGKRVYSIEEMIQQNRTIWFLRETGPQDPVQEISFLDQERIEPADFPRRYRQSMSRNILWVSDLHYSEAGYHGFPIQPTLSQKSVGSAIEQCMKERELNDLAGVIVSGDITWKASPEEYSQAHAFFDWQKQWAKLNNLDFLICPGNHDLVFSEDPAKKDSPVTVAPEVARIGFQKLYQDLFFKAPNQFLSSGRKFLVGNALAVEIVCLNSSLLEQEKGLFQGHGFLGDAQLEDAAQEMGWEPKAVGPRSFRIVVLHHHLMPVTFREEPKKGQVYSVVLDAEALARWVVRYRVDLVLHGHMHHPFCARLSRPIEVDRPEGQWHCFHVVGLGSTGVAKDHLGEVAKNTFGLLRFEETYLDMKVYTIDPTNPAQDLWSLHIPYDGRES